MRNAGAAIAHFGNERVRRSRFHGHPGPRGTLALLLSFVEVAQHLLELLSRHRRKARAQHVELRRAENGAKSRFRQDRAIREIGYQGKSLG